MRSPAVVVALLAALSPPVSAAPQASYEGEPALVFGLVRSYGMEATRKSSQLIEEYLTGRLGRRVTSRIYVDAEALGEALARGNVDLAQITPLAYLQAVKLAPITIIRRVKVNGLPYYRSVIFVRADSPVQRMSAMAGRTIAWGPKGSTSSNLTPRAMLLGQSVNIDKLFGKQLVLKDHAAVCNAVYTGAADAGASFTTDELDISPQITGCLPMFQGKLDSFRLLEKSDKIPNDVIAARPKFDQQLASKIGALLEVLSPLDEVLTEGFRCTGFDSGSDRDFESVRKAMKLVPKG